MKTKRYPLSRVRRLVLAAFLQIPAQAHQTPPPYLRVLGMNERGREILSRMKRTASLPVSVSLSRLAQSSPEASALAALEAACARPVRPVHRADFPLRAGLQRAGGEGVERK